MTGTDLNLLKEFQYSKKGRTLGNTEQNWCRAVSCGTGNTVLVLEMAKSPSKIPLLHQVLKKLRQSHPVLCYKLHYSPTTKEFSFLNPTVTPQTKVEFHDVPTTTQLLHSLSAKQKHCSQLSLCHLILEHEMNNNIWGDPSSFPCEGIDVVFASVYALSETKSMVTLRLHASVCDRATAESLLRELMELVSEEEGGRKMVGIKNDGEGDMGIEDMAPRRMGKKTLWAHGIDMLGYSVSSLRLTNLRFKNTKQARYSEVLRLQMNKHQTAGLLAGCKSRGVKLCGALAAAGLIAAHSTRLDSDKLKKKYGVITLIDCRSLLEPVLSIHHFGFYQLSILNMYTINGTENLWDLTEKTYTDFTRYKKCNKHLTDLADINFLMAKAIANPSLTASSSLRTSLISVFEDPTIDDTKLMKQEIGVEDYMGCSSAHGIGPSIALFDTIRNGELDCACVYPAPLHSREQMNELVDHMKNILIDGSY